MEKPQFPSAPQTQRRSPSIRYPGPAWGSARSCNNRIHSDRDNDNDNGDSNDSETLEDNAMLPRHPTLQSLLMRVLQRFAKHITASEQRNHFPSPNASKSAPYYHPTAPDTSHSRADSPQSATATRKRTCDCTVFITRANANGSRSHPT
mmetsp:Transcript_27174/g.70506  ORF Transcript_27174/g.70506 Transcript_27174/m.70506 type:complete len:149 (-) Transcript_27174:13-459(-)